MGRKQTKEKVIRFTWSNRDSLFPVSLVVEPTWGLRPGPLPPQGTLPGSGQEDWGDPQKGQTTRCTAAPLGCQNETHTAQPTPFVFSGILCADTWSYLLILNLLDESLWFYPFEVKQCSL